MAGRELTNSPIQYANSSDNNTDDDDDEQNMEEDQNLVIGNSSASEGSEEENEYLDYDSKKAEYSTSSERGSISAVDSDLEAGINNESDLPNETNDEEEDDYKDESDENYKPSSLDGEDIDDDDEDNESLNLESGTESEKSMRTSRKERAYRRRRRRIMNEDDILWFNAFACDSTYVDEAALLLNRRPYYEKYSFYIAFVTMLLIMIIPALVYLWHNGCSLNHWY